MNFIVLVLLDGYEQTVYYAISSETGTCNNLSQNSAQFVIHVKDSCLCIRSLYLVVFFPDVELSHFK